MTIIFENEKEYREYIDGMDEYIQNLRKLQKEDAERARKQAQASLKRSGILNEDGTIKEIIKSTILEKLSSDELWELAGME